MQGNESSNYTFVSDYQTGGGGYSTEDMVDTSSYPSGLPSQFWSGGTQLQGEGASEEGEKGYEVATFGFETSSATSFYSENIPASDYFDFFNYRDSHSHPHPYPHPGPAPQQQPQAQERYLVSQSTGGEPMYPPQDTHLYSTATPDIFSALGINDVDAPMTAETLIDTYANEVVSPASLLPAATPQYQPLTPSTYFQQTQQHPEPPLHPFQPDSHHELHPHYENSGDAPGSGTHMITHTQPVEQAAEPPVAQLPTEASVNIPSSSATGGGEVVLSNNSTPVTDGEISTAALTTISTVGSLQSPASKEIENKDSQENEKSETVPYFDLIEEVKCFKCKICDYITLTEKYVLNHLRKKHKSAIVDNLQSAVRINGANGLKKPTSGHKTHPYVCSKCFVGFISLESCRQHMSVTHKIKTDKIWLEQISSNSTKSTNHNSIYGNRNDKTRYLVSEKTSGEGNCVTDTSNNYIQLQTLSDFGTVNSHPSIPNSQVNGQNKGHVLNPLANQFNCNIIANISCNQINGSSPFISSESQLINQIRSSSKVRQILPNGKVDGLKKSKQLISAAMSKNMKNKKVAWLKKMKREQGTFICEFKGIFYQLLYPSHICQFIF